jgi:hypothetical protein
MRALAFAVALSLSAGVVPARAQSPTEVNISPAQSEETFDIYVIRGSTENLKRFHAEVGQDWTGGTFLRRLSTSKEYRYWAYPTREAREARVFIFGLMNSGLEFDIEPYNQWAAYPSERKLLDEIILRCGTKSDPFLIQPDRTLAVRLAPRETFEIAECVLNEANKAEFGEKMPIGFLGNEAPAKDDK